MFQGSHKRVSRKFQECFKEVFGKFQGCLIIIVSRVFQVGRCFSSSFKGVSRKFKRSLKSGSGKFKWCFKGVSRNFSRSFNFQECFKKFQGYFTKVSRVFYGRLKGIARQFSVGFMGI